MQEIYQDKILELAKLVRLSQPISEPTHTGEKNNPICGDKVIINAVIKNGIVIDIHLIVRGCALCEAGAGLLGKTAINRNMDDLITLKDEMNGYLKNNEQIGWRVSIYIANVFLWLETLDLWKTFSHRVATIYLPDRKRPMLPTVLSDTLCSLQENQNRFALAMDIYIDMEGNFLEDIEAVKCINKGL